MLCRDTATWAGSAGTAANRASGIGSSQPTSGCSSLSGVPGSAGAPRPEGSGRRRRVSMARRQALVAIRYSQVRSEDRPSNWP